jgi:hypothetical protein
MASAPSATKRPASRGVEVELEQATPPAAKRTRVQPSPSTEHGTALGGGTAAQPRDPAAADYAKALLACEAAQRHGAAAGVSPGFLSLQPDVTPETRAALLDWLVDVHAALLLPPGALFLAAAFVDRFLEARVVTRKHLQLLGLAATFTASRAEADPARRELPTAAALAATSHGACTENQVWEMLGALRAAVACYVAAPTTFDFLLRLFKSAGWDGEGEGDREVRAAATCLAELALLDASMLRFPPPVLAAAAAAAVGAAGGRGPPPTAALARHAGCREPALMECAAKLLALLRAAPEAPLTAVYRKYCGGGEGVGQGGGGAAVRALRLGAPPAAGAPEQQRRALASRQAALARREQRLAGEAASFFQDALALGWRSIWAELGVDGQAACAGRRAQLEDEATWLFEAKRQADREELRLQAEEAAGAAQLPAAARPPLLSPAAQAAAFMRAALDRVPRASERLRLFNIGWEPPLSAQHAAAPRRVSWQTPLAPPPLPQLPMLPTPQPITPDQRARAEASRQAALARRRERQRQQQQQQQQQQAWEQRQRRQQQAVRPCPQRLTPEQLARAESNRQEAVSRQRQRQFQARLLSPACASPHSPVTEEQRARAEASRRAALARRQQAQQAPTASSSQASDPDEEDDTTLASISASSASSDNGQWADSEGPSETGEEPPRSDDNNPDVHHDDERGATF